MIVILYARTLAPAVTILLLTLIAVSAALVLVHTVTGLGEAKEGEGSPADALVIEDVVEGALIVRNVGWREAHVSALYVIEPSDKRLLSAYRFDPPLTIAPLEAREIPIPSDIRGAAKEGETVLYVLRSTHAAAEARLGPFLPQYTPGGSSGSILGLPSSIGTVLWLSGTSGSTLVGFTYNDTNGSFHTLIARGGSGGLSVADWSTWSPSDLFYAFQTPTIPVWNAGGDILVLGTTPPNATQKAATLLRFLDSQSLAPIRSLQVTKSASASTTGTTVVELGGPPGLPEAAAPMSAFYDAASQTIYWLGVTSITRTDQTGNTVATHAANYVARLDVSTFSAEYLVFWVPTLPGTPRQWDYPLLMPPGGTVTTFGFHDGGLAVFGGKVYALGIVAEPSLQPTLVPGIAVFDPALTRVERLVLFNGTLFNVTGWNSLYFLKAGGQQLVVAGDGYVYRFVTTATPGTAGPGQSAFAAYDVSAPALVALDPVTFDVTYTSIFGDTAMHYTTIGLAVSGNTALQLMASTEILGQPRHDLLLAVHDLAQKKLLAVQNLTITVNGAPLPTAYSGSLRGQALIHFTPTHVDINGGNLILTIAGLNTTSITPVPESIIQLQIPLDRFISLKAGDTITLAGNDNITLIINPNTATVNHTAAQTLYTTGNLLRIVSTPETSFGFSIVERTVDNRATVSPYTPAAVQPPLLTLSESTER